MFDKVKCEVRVNTSIENVASERFFYDVNFEKIISEANEKMIELDDEFIKLSQSVDRQHMEHIFANVARNKDV